MSDDDLIDRGKAIAERLQILDGDAVPGSRNGSREPGTAENHSTVPGSGNHAGTAAVAENATVPGSAPLLREPGTAPEKPLYVYISALIDGTAPEPPAPVLGKRTDGRYLFYARQVNWVFGDPESGKTWLCSACAAENLNTGRRTLIVDLDHNGAAATVHRLIALGASEDALRNPDLFRYCEPDDRAELRQVIDDSQKWRPALAIVDSIGFPRDYRAARGVSRSRFARQE